MKMILLLMLSLSSLAWGQAKVDATNRSFAGTIDASGSPKTVVVSVGTNSSRPTSSCSPGQMYYQTDSTAGLYLNSATGTCSWAIAGGGGSAPTMSSTAGYWAPLGVTNNDANGTVFASKVPRFVKFTTPNINIPVATLIYYIVTPGGATECTGAACGFAAAIYSGDCSTNLKNLTTSTATTGTILQLTVASGYTLDANTTYVLGYASDSSTIRLAVSSAGTGFGYLSNNAAGPPRWYFATDDTVTGDNGTLAMPSACTGTKSNVTSFPQPEWSIFTL